jgi:hypothetical protein
MPSIASFLTASGAGALRAVSCSRGSAWRPVGIQGTQESKSRLMAWRERSLPTHIGGWPLAGMEVSKCRRG